MERITKVTKLNEGDYLLYKCCNGLVCIYKVAYLDTSDNNHFVRYKVVKAFANSRLGSFFSWDNINTFHELFRLNNEELIAYMM